MMIFSIDGFGTAVEERARLVSRLALGLAAARALTDRLNTARQTLMIPSDDSIAIKNDLANLERSYDAALVQTGTATAMELAALRLEADRLDANLQRQTARVSSVIASARGSAGGPPTPQSSVVESAAVPVALAIGAGVLGLLFIATRP